MTAKRWLRRRPDSSDWKRISKIPSAPLAISPYDLSSSMKRRMQRLSGQLIAMAVERPHGIAVVESIVASLLRPRRKSDR